ncbi:hydrogenase formation protein HypD [Sphingobacteriales bacterium UPWRP_1]|nr:hydrogenase formation protein HypD [Sphingobacteriales bacterium TSM_CSS]PSJ77605.1 hydrogenase formation protein HypD [Sphingobacteriales bacterium UPWRP_1]
MKYLSEYRDAQLVEHLLHQINQTITRPWTIMEICGGQTHGLVKNGIIDLLPPQITMVHGPGCPVCVTPVGLIDDAIELAEKQQVILCSFGDMLRVPGSGKSLLEAKAGGADVRMVYSPLDALQIAQKNPHREVVFFAVGFETTAPANALSVIQASRLQVNNYSILASQVLVPPAMEAILSDPQQHINAFLAAGHVCTIMGLEEYEPIARKYHIPIVVTGFEPVDLLHGILMAVKQLEKGYANVENQYARVVYAHGNAHARKVIDTVFEVSEREWRGIGNIEGSGYEVRNEFAAHNARIKFGLQHREAPEQSECIAGAVLKGLKKPRECPNFGTKCRPENPLGAPMVSSEGACAAYYHYASGNLLLQHDKV